MAQEKSLAQKEFNLRAIARIIIGRHGEETRRRRGLDVEKLIIP